MLRSSRRRFLEFLGEFRAGRLSVDEHAGQDTGHRQAAKPRWSYLRFYFEWLGPYKGSIIFVLALGLTAACLGLVLPYVTKLIVDQILQSADLATQPGRQARLLHLAGGGALLVVLIQQSLEALRNYRMHLLNFRVLRRL